MTDNRTTMSSRRRGLRKPIPPLIFLLVLALLALGVWWKVLKRDEARQAAADPPCATAPAASGAPVDPATVQVRVLNATSRAGLAGEVAAELSARGFPIAEVGNDASGREVLGLGEVRYGPRGAAQAQLVAAQFPGLSPVKDDRTDLSVDVALGPDYTALTPPEQVPAALAAAAAAAASSAAPTC